MNAKPETIELYLYAEVGCMLTPRKRTESDLITAQQQLSGEMWLTRLSTWIKEIVKLYMVQG